MNQIDKMIGNIIGKPRVRGGKNDWDGDGVTNRKDCQPRNVMRQDASRRKRRTKSFKELSLEQVRQIYGTYVGSDISDKTLNLLKKEDMKELLINDLRYNE